MINQEEQEQEQRSDVNKIQAIGNLEVFYACKKHIVIFIQKDEKNEELWVEN